MAANEPPAPPTPTPPARALVVMAHPDDIEFTCGGTVAKLAEAGCDVSFCLVTSGDKGSKDASRTSWELARAREVEQEAAARVLGVQRCIFLRWPDGFVEDAPALRGQIVRVIREQRPDLVITWDPARGFNHRDHRTVGQVTVDAVFPLARTPHYFREQLTDGLAPHRVNELLLAGTPSPTTSWTSATSWSAAPMPSGGTPARSAVTGPSVGSAGANRPNAPPTPVRYPGPRHFAGSSWGSAARPIGRRCSLRQSRRRKTARRAKGPRADERWRTWRSTYFGRDWWPQGCRPPST